MRNEPTKRLASATLPLWRLKGGFYCLIFLFIPIGYIVGTFFFPWPRLLFWVLLGVWAATSFFLIVTFPYLRWKRWKYDVYQKEIDLQHGVWVVKRTLIPMNRVQHVDTEQGPLYRRYQLATVTISTAATVHHIPSLSEEVANHLRDRIAVLAQTAEVHD